jgi:hypothetical protein
VETLQAFGALFQIPHYYRKFLHCKKCYVIIFKSVKIRFNLYLTFSSFSKTFSISNQLTFHFPLIPPFYFTLVLILFHSPFFIFFSYVFLLLLQLAPYLFTQYVTIIFFSIFYYSKSSHERTPSVANFLSVQQRCPLKRNISRSKEKIYVGHNIK